jgi:hypothetical protein
MSPKLHELVSEMLRMLITYEIELTAYNIVIEAHKTRSFTPEFLGICGVMFGRY